MNSKFVTTTFVTTAVILIAVCVSQTRSAQSSSATSQTAPKPLLLEKNEGERRIWRDVPPGEFILKISPKNNDSQHLVLVTEDLHAGD